MGLGERLVGLIDEQMPLALSLFGFASGAFCGLLGRDALLLGDAVGRGDPLLDFPEETRGALLERPRLAIGPA
jgi:hypothetical protein